MGFYVDGIGTLGAIQLIDNQYISFVWETKSLIHAKCLVIMFILSQTTIIFSDVPVSVWVALFRVCLRSLCVNISSVGYIYNISNPRLLYFSLLNTLLTLKLVTGNRLQQSFFPFYVFYGHSGTVSQLSEKYHLVIKNNVRPCVVALHSLRLVYSFLETDRGVLL